MITIKGMKMPKHCMTCEFHDQMYNRCNIGHFETGAKFIKGDAKWYFKHPNCPLVEIVTCKDCKYTRQNDDNERYCDLSGRYYDPDYFCANAERRE